MEVIRRCRSLVAKGCVMDILDILDKQLRGNEWLEMVMETTDAMDAMV